MNTISSNKTALQNLAECKRWLAALPLTNIPMAQAEIMHQLELLEGAYISAVERLKMVEHMRETIDFIQGQSARRYLNKPMPPAAVEHAAWQGSIGLWRALRSSYQRCLDAALANEADIQEWMPLLTQRCLRYTTFLMIEQYRVYREVDAATWQHLNRLYLLAEERGFERKPVKDSLNRQIDASTCQATYVHALLITAARPCHLSARHLNVLDKWLDKWAVRVPMSKEPPPQEQDLPVWAIDVQGQSAPVQVKAGMQGENWRYLHTAKLAEGVRKRIKFLRKGGAPGELDVGEDCVQPGCEPFLTDIYRNWCEAVMERAVARRASDQQAETVLGMLAGYACVNDMVAFEQPAKRQEYSRQALQDLQMFGHVREQSTGKLTAKQAGIEVVEWDVLDESALGFRLGRKDIGNVRIVFGQFVALRPTDASNFALGSVKWMSFRNDGSAEIGISLMPGSAQAVAARQIKLQSADPDFAPAFRLPAIPAMKLPETLVLPRGWFKARALVEIHDGKQARSYTMNEVLERGSDFERVSFS